MNGTIALHTLDTHTSRGSYIRWICVVYTCKLLTFYYMYLLNSNWRRLLEIWTGDRFAVGWPSLNSNRRTREGCSRVMTSLNSKRLSRLPLPDKIRTFPCRTCQGTSCISSRKSRPKSQKRIVTLLAYGVLGKKENLLEKIVFD